MRPIYILLILCFSLSANAQETTELPVYKASNALEFLKVVGNDRKIIVSDTIKIIASSLEKEFGVKDYKTIVSPAKDFMFDGDGLILHGYKNLTITGTNNAAFITYSENDDVLTLEQCDNILLENIAIFHETPNGCAGEVLEIIHSKNIMLNNVDLNGSGAVGLNLLNVQNTTVQNSKFYNNNQSAIQAFFSSNINIKNTSFTDNHTDVFFILELSDIHFDSCYFGDNKTDEILDIDQFSKLKFTDNCEFVDEGFKEGIDSTLNSLKEEIYFEYEEEVSYEDFKKPGINEYTYPTIIKDYFFALLENDYDRHILYALLDKDIKWKNKNINQVKDFFDTNYSIQKYKIIDYKGIGTNKLVVTVNHSFIEAYEYEKIESKILVWEFVFNENHKIIEINELESTLLPSKNTGLPLALKTENAVLSYFTNDWLHALSRDYFDIIENDKISGVYSFFEKNVRITGMRFNSFDYKLGKMSKKDKKKFQQFYMKIKKRAWKEIEKELNTNIIKANYNDVLALFENAFKVSSHYYKGDKFIDKKKTNLNLLIPEIPDLNNKKITECIYSLNSSVVSDLNYFLYNKKWKLKTNIEKEISRYVDYNKEKDNLSIKNQKALEKYLNDYQKVFENLNQL